MNSEFVKLRDDFAKLNMLPARKLRLHIYVTLNTKLIKLAVSLLSKDRVVNRPNKRIVN